MARRIEICVPTEYAEVVKEILESPDKCDLGDNSPKPGIIVEMEGKGTTVFTITVPSGAVSGHLEVLRNNGLGTALGTVALLSMDALKPRFNKGLLIPRRPGVLTPMKSSDGKDIKQTNQGFRDFQKARLTTEEIYNTILNLANMTINTWVNLIGASVIAVGGLASNATVFIVASMLVSPIMGPIMGMTFGYRIGDWQLFRMGVINEAKMAFAAYVVGAICGLIIGSVGKTYNWPTSAMQTDGQAFALIISVMVSAAAGAVLAVTLTSGGINSLVGTAISAGLLPPIVNAGMLMAYAGCYAPPERRYDFYEMGVYAIVFYASHVITIFVVANTVFWLKEIDPRFSSSEDNSYQDLPSVSALMKRKAEGGNFFLDNMKTEFEGLKDDIEEFGHDIKHKTTDLAGNIIDGVKTGVHGVAEVTGMSSSKTSGGRAHRPSDADIEGHRSSGLGVSGGGASASASGGGGGFGTRRGVKKVPLEDEQLREEKLFPGNSGAPPTTRTRQRSRSRQVDASAINSDVEIGGYADIPLATSALRSTTTAAAGEKAAGGNTATTIGSASAGAAGATSGEDTTKNPMFEFI